MQTGTRGVAVAALWAVLSGGLGCSVDVDREPAEATTQSAAGKADEDLGILLVTEDDDGEMVQIAGEQTVELRLLTQPGTEWWVIRIDKTIGYPEPDFLGDPSGDLFMVFRWESLSVARGMTHDVELELVGEDGIILDNFSITFGNLDESGRL